MLDLEGSDCVFCEDGMGGLKFVGDFERLYVNDPDPWLQSAPIGWRGQYYRRSRDDLAAALEHHIQRGNVLEVGCGLGYSLQYLAVKMPMLRLTGLDISPTAIKKARERWPTLTFKQGDIALWHEGQYNTIILSQVLWYILDRLPAVMDNCRELLANNGLLVFTQGFLREQRYGADQVNGFNGLVRWMALNKADQFELLEAKYDPSDRYLLRDGLLIYRKS